MKVPLPLRALSLTALAAAFAVPEAGAATCSTEGCTLPMTSSLYVNNNTWGSANSPAGWAESVTVSSASAWRVDFKWPVAGNPTQDNAVKAYPSAVYGWHFGWYYPQSATQLPQQLSAPYTAISSYQYTASFGGGTGNVTYDLWLTNTATPDNATQPTDEIMIWVNSTGGAGPCGAPTVSNITLEGGTWTLSECQVPNYQYVWSFVRTSNSASGTLDLKNFINYLRTNRGLSSTKYLAGIEFGSEIFRGTGNVNFTNYTCAVTPGGGIVAGGTYRIEALHSGKTLRASGTANGNAVVQYTYSGGTNQRWTLTHLGNNMYKIIGVQSGRALEIASATTANGTLADIGSYTGAPNQKWIISAAPTAGYYRLTPASSTGSALEVSNGSTADNARVQQWTWSTTARHKQWRFRAP